MKIKKVQLNPAAGSDPQESAANNNPKSSKSKKLQPNSVGSLNAASTSTTATTATTATTTSPVPTQKRTKRRKKQSSSPSTTTPASLGSAAAATPSNKDTLKRRRIVKEPQVVGMDSNSPAQQQQPNPSPNDKKQNQKIDNSEGGADDFSAFFDRSPTPDDEKAPAALTDPKSIEEDPQQANPAYLEDNYPYMHVFTTTLANAAFEAVRSGKFSSIIGFHIDQKGDPAKVMLEKEKQMRREANLARLKQIGGMLNIYSSKKRPSETLAKNGDDHRKKPRSSTLMPGPRLHRAGPPERFGSLTEFTRRNPPPIPYGGNAAELQTAPSPQHMNYEIHGQELIITRQLNPRHRPTSSALDSSSSPMMVNRDQMAEPLSHMLHMTNNIPRPPSDPKRIQSPPKSDYIPPPPPQPNPPQSQQIQRPQRPRMMYMDLPPPPSVLPNFGNHPRMMMAPPHQPVNNTFVNATMSIQQLNIQSMPETAPNAPPPPTSYMMPIDHHHHQMMTAIPPPHHHHPRMQQFNPMMRAAPRCVGPPPPPNRFRPPPPDSLMMTTPSPSSQMINKQFIEHHHHHHQQQPMMMQRMMMPSQMMCPPPQRFMYCGGTHHQQLMQPMPPNDQLMMPIDHPSHHHFHYESAMMDGMMPPPQPPAMIESMKRMMPPQQQQQMYPQPQNDYGGQSSSHQQIYVESAPSAHAADLMNSPATFMQQPQQQPQPPPADQFLNSGTCNQ